MLVPVILGAVLVLTYIYFNLYRPLCYWQNLGVKQDNPLTLLKKLLLTFYNVIFKREDPLEAVINRYDKFPGSRYYGIYEMTSPGLMVKDADLVTQMLVTDYVHFNDHRVLIHDDLDPLFTKCIFALKGEEWQKVRKTVTPSYTSSKMKGLFSTMNEYSERLAKHFLSRKEDVLRIEMRDTTTRFCNDSSAKMSFGINVDSFAEPNNEFWQMCHKAVDTISKPKVLSFNVYLLAPKLVKFLKMKIVDWDADSFFRQIISDTMKIREKERENGILGADLIHLLLEGRKRAKMNKDKETNVKSTYKNYNADWSNMDIIAQAFFFHFASCAPAPTLLSFMGYELAVNPDVQEKVREEIRETDEICGGKLTYEVLNRMKYIDMVVQESMRKWPSVIEVDRICSKDYVIQPVLPEEKPVLVKRGSRVIVPIYSLHHDPQFFPEPERFIPERFSDENKHKIKPNTFTPFGFGSRTCMGSKYSILQAKLMYYHILSHFEIVPVEKTKVPLEVAKIPRLNAEGGLWVGLKRLDC
ncbi:cytochrome P450 9e2 [Leptinotarsa decemlineata]|uniref:cytochrome P450 9e2 n=1 Tax=Leptinotarsa decemlineata TaxID=7539 RepID=UPI003D304ECF